jgi:para-aminobenzoate synthetase/4-amino-4-deoxychorismate lyase
MLFESATAPGSTSSYFFEDPVRSIEVRSPEEMPAALLAMERALDEGLWVAGYFGYECGYHWEPRAGRNFQPAGDLPLAALGMYRSPTIPVVPSTPQPGCGLAAVVPSLSPQQFDERFSRIQRWITAGDTYQVNLTFRVEASYSDGADLLFAHMMQAQPVAFGAMLHAGGRVVLSASPELFFRLEGRKLYVHPMKGTARRGRDRAEDDQFAAGLARDEKNRAENIMIVDLLRSDIGRIAETGSVRVEGLFEVERHPSLMQMTSRVTGTLNPEVSLYQLFGALFPSGSIVGAPKVRTMQIIRELEARDRGVYTGAIGYITPEREAVFSVAIRTAVLEQGKVSMGVGAGITSGSQSEAEYAECLLKADFLLDRSFELIESLRWERGCCELVDLHLERLRNSAEFFGFPFDGGSMRAAIERKASQLAAGEVQKIRLTLNSAGAYRITGSRIDPDSFSPLKVRLWADPMQSGDSWLQHKTTRRVLYDEASRVAQEAGCVDAIFSNEFGMLTEGAIHSVLLCHGDRWRTPPLSAGVLPGVYRRHLLSTRPEIREQDVAVDELWTADHIYLMNAVRGLRRVLLETGLLRRAGS